MPTSAVFRARQSTTGRYTSVLKDETDTVLSSLQVSTLTLTLYDRGTGEILNSRDDTNVLNTGGGSLDGSGNFAMIFTDLDNAMLDDSVDTEVHVALFKWTYGAKKGSHEVTIRVMDVTKVGSN